jgi:hypothetical protein
MKLIIAIVLTILMSTCSSPEKQGLNYKDMFENGMENQSTAPNFIVINVYDLNTSETKEICCESIDLSYALTLDSQKMNDRIKYDNRGIPTFKFRSIKALNQLRFYQYEVKTFDSLILNTKHDLIDKILQENIETGYSKLLEINTIKFRENYFEHFLYINGIVTYRDCESGYTCISNEK